MDGDNHIGTRSSSSQRRFSKLIHETVSVCPAHERVLVPAPGDPSITVPVTRVHLTTGETFDRYCTTGPGSDPAAGLPPLRAAWVEERLDARRVARARRDFAAADAIRAELVRG